MTAKAKLAQKRLTLLQLAEKLGNVSKACQMHKVSRNSLKKYKETCRHRFHKDAKRRRGYCVLMDKDSGNAEHNQFV